MSLPISPQGIPRFDMRPQGHQQFVHRSEQPIVLFVSCGPDRYAYTWTRDGWDVQLVCFVPTHQFASTPYREEDRALCNRCPHCEWERWLTGRECDLGHQRFLDLHAGIPTAIALGPQGH